MRKPRVNGDALRYARPERVGLSSAGLARIGESFRPDVERGRVPGVVTVVARRGEVAHFEAIGRRDPNAPGAMARDSVFRIASMTKPIVTVALMMLHEQGRFTLADPIGQYLPVLARMRVAVPRPGGPEGNHLLEPAVRPITIHDLLRHTSGFTYSFRPTHLARLYQDLDARRLDLTNAELVEALGGLPLAFQPGTVWEYGYNVEILGHLIEVLSGRALGQYLSEFIYKPLGMTDTGFWLRKDQWIRAAEAGVHPDTGQSQPLQDHRIPRKLERGGGGLVSTAADYLRFCQMLLNGGEGEGVRLLSARTLAWMTSDHLGAIPVGDSFYPGAGYSFGLGFAVRKAAGLSDVPGSAGEYNWFGWAGTVFWVDPREELIAILMIQSPALNFEFPRRFRALVYGAVVE